MQVRGRGTTVVPQAYTTSHYGFVFEFTYYVTDEVVFADPVSGIFVLESGIPLRIDDGVHIDRSS